MQKPFEASCDVSQTIIFSAHPTKTSNKHFEHFMARWRKALTDRWKARSAAQRRHLLWQLRGATRRTRFFRVEDQFFYQILGRLDQFPECFFNFWVWNFDPFLGCVSIFVGSFAIWGCRKQTNKRYNKSILKKRKREREREKKIQSCRNLDWSQDCCTSDLEKEEWNWKNLGVANRASSRNRALENILRPWPSEGICPKSISQITSKFDASKHTVKDCFHMFSHRTYLYI